MRIYAIVDCNNFFVSCERVFNPKLLNKPVIVLSNNDGCAIARSNEAKALEIRMGAPYFQIREVCERNKVEVFSSNYQLYGDMSARVIEVICEDWHKIEVYSIDEAFIETEVKDENEAYELFTQLRSKIIKHVGIPVSIGISITKTLAKIAGNFAKKSKGGVCCLLREDDIKNALLNTGIRDIWGVGRKLEEKFKWLGINNAYKLSRIEPEVLKMFNVVIQRLVAELNSIPMLELEEVSDKKSITCSRSFGRKVTRLEDLEDVIANYVVKACEKLRSQENVVKELYVFVSTTAFENTGLSYSLDYPTDDSRIIIRMAKIMIKRMYKNNVSYRKAGIILMDLFKKSGPIQLQLFDNKQYTNPKKTEALMKVMDMLNKSGNKVFYAAQGINCGWKMRNAYKSPCYTSKWEELLKVF